MCGTRANGIGLGVELGSGDRVRPPACSHSSLCKARWQELCGKRHTVVFISLRHLFSWTKIFSIALFVLLGQECKKVTCDWCLSEEVTAYNRPRLRCVSCVFCWPVLAMWADLCPLYMACVLTCDGGRLDLVCDVKGPIQYLLRLVHPHKGEVNVGGVPHKTRSTK